MNSSAALAARRGLEAEMAASKYSVHHDDKDWLDPWLPLIAVHTLDAPVLELGCGEGRDTAALLAAGHAVIALDRDPRALAEARTRSPGASYFQQDLLAPLPLAPESVGVVLASLCLHYFAWPETMQLVRRIRDVLRPEGLLITRVNSINDHNHGASGHPMLAENLYIVDGKTKRFFDRDSLDAVFSHGWHPISIREQTIHRYALPKAVWELVLEKSATNSGESSATVAIESRPSALFAPMSSKTNA